METVKLPDELVSEIKQLRDELAQNVVKIGRMNVQLSFYRKDMLLMEQQLDSFYREAEEIADRETKLQNKVVAEYGAGKLDFDSGVFTKD